MGSEDGHARHPAGEEAVPQRVASVAEHARQAPLASQ